MALTVAEAHQVNVLLDHLSGSVPDYDAAQLAAYSLAESAYKKLGAGVRGWDVDQWWEARMGPAPERGT